ncbi:hypothetical protein B6I21_08760, partial [candidate division KSB1 bacterium 4572_119]
MKKKCFLFTVLILLITSINSISLENPSVRLLKSEQSGKEIYRYFFREDKQKKIYPFLKVSENELEFFLPDGRLLTTFSYLPQSNVITSKGQNFVAFIQRSDSFEVPGLYADKKKFVYRITNFKGQEKYSIKLELHQSEPIPAIYLNNDGRSILVDGAAAKIQLFSLNGAIIRSIDLFEDNIYNYEKPIYCATNALGNFAVIAQKKPATFIEDNAEFISGEPWLFYFSHDGTEIWRKKLDAWSVSDLSISESGRIILVSSHTPVYGSNPRLKTYIFDSSGEEMAALPLLFRYAAFTDRDSLFYLADRSGIFLVDIENGKLNWQNFYNFEKTKTIINIFHTSNN